MQRLAIALLLCVLVFPDGNLRAQAAAALPRPSYDNTVYVFIDGPLFLDDASFQSSANFILQRLTPGPYARVGVAGYILVDMPWTYDALSAALSSPSTSQLTAKMARAQARGLVVHLSTVAGISRTTGIYNAAKREDRRNCQWYLDNMLMRSGQSFSSDVWLTPSRYARKLRRHLETKVRLLARLLISLRKAYPDTFVSASGDGEMELNDGALDDSLPLNSQVIADYSPFAIAEFRDWIQHTGLYAPGQAYEGQGYSQGGIIYQGAPGLAAFNLAFGTSFSTWRLKYFDWDVLTDPVDGDPKVIPASTYENPIWSPLPSSGSDFILGGFDAPRSWNQPTQAFWELWLAFRQAMIANYVNDFASWITTTPDTEGTTFDPNRWYTHQLPADYLNNTYPGCPNPEPRLLTSASPMRTGIVGNTASLGFTMFDVVQSYGYQRTSRYLLDDLKALNLPNWGLPEYSPSWPVTAIDNDAAAIATTIRRAYDAGAHIMVYLVWEHFISTVNPQAFGLFLAQVRNQPRNSATTSYLPPQVSGLAGTVVGRQVNLSWHDRIFQDVPDLVWTAWPTFSHFEVWRGATSDFGVATGERLGTTSSASFGDLAPDPSLRYYKVAAVTSSAQRGPFSDPWLAGAPPMITTVDPNWGSTLGGTTITIAGLGFANGAMVTIGGIAATAVTVVNSDTITATTAAYATGTVDVTVANPGTLPAVLSQGFTFTSANVTPLSFYTLAPCRVLDTRNDSGPDAAAPALAPSETRQLSVAGRCGIPATAVSVSVNVTVVEPQAPGYLSFFPGGGPAPLVSSLNFTAGQIRANNAVLVLASDGSGTLSVLNGCAGLNHLILDVNGYFQ